MSITAVFLPLASPDEDAETAAWCRGWALASGSELRRRGGAAWSFAGWTAGRGAELRLAHLTTAPPTAHIAAFAQAAGAQLGISGWARWRDEGALTLATVRADGSAARRFDVDAGRRPTALDLARAAFRTACGILDVDPGPLPAEFTHTDSDGAVLAMLQDGVQGWFDRRRGQEPSGGSRLLLSALGQDPRYDPAARAVLRRCGAGLDDGPARLQAIDDLQSLLRLRPDDAPAWTLLAMLHRRDQHLDPAEQAVRQALRASPDFAAAHRELGLQQLDVGAHKSAGAHLRRAGRLAPKDAETHLGLGQLCLVMGERERAEGHLASVLRLAPGTAAAGEAARTLRDLDEGPHRPGAARPRRGADRDVIARTFGRSTRLPSPLRDTSKNLRPSAPSPAAPPGETGSDFAVARSKGGTAPSVPPVRGPSPTDRLGHPDDDS